MRKKCILLLATILVVSSLSYSADVPHKLQVTLMLKILSMDRNFDRFGDPIKIGVSSDSFLSVIKGKEGIKVKGKKFVVEKMSSPSDIAKYKVVYVGKGWASQYSAAADAATKNQALMFCETEDAVLSGGGAISFKVVGNKPKIVINLGNVKNQGTNFPADFLKITVVVGSFN